MFQLTLIDDFTMASLYGLLDENIEPLVVALNSLPGVKTIGSCGGHKNPSSIQRPEGEWFVSFDFCGCDRASEYLSELVSAIYRGDLDDEHGVTSLEVYSQSFALCGYGSDPKGVADYIKDYMHD